MNKRIDRIYFRGLRLLDQFYDRDESKEVIQKTCKYPGCGEEITKGKYCNKHVKIRRKEAALLGWGTRNSKK